MSGEVTTELRDQGKTGEPDARVDGDSLAEQLFRSAAPEGTEVSVSEKLSQIDPHSPQAEANIASIIINGSDPNAKEIVPSDLRAALVGTGIDDETRDRLNVVIEKLGKTIEQNNEKARLLNELSPEEVDRIISSDDILDESDAEQDPDKWGFKTFAILTLVFVADFTFNKGYGTQNLMVAILKKAVRGRVNNFFSELGFEVPEGTDSSEYTNKILESMDTISLKRFLTDLNREETFNFLESLSQEAREKLVSGKRFGGLFGKHQIDEQEIRNSLLDKLDSAQLNHLGISPPQAAAAA